MKTKTNIGTEYTVCGKTPQGKWRPITTQLFGSQLEAERYLEKHEKARAEHPRYFKGCNECKVMKRTAIVTLGEWEDVTNADEREGAENGKEST